MYTQLVRITTAPNGERTAVIASQELEEQYGKGIGTGRPYILEKADSLADGDYPLSDFDVIPLSANIIPDGEGMKESSIDGALVYRKG